MSEQAELNTLRQQAGELSGVAQELHQTRQSLLELQAVARQLEQHRVQIAGLADQKAELEGALQQQAELTAEVSVLQRDYDDMLDKARKALTLQEELPKLQVGLTGVESCLAWDIQKIACANGQNVLLGVAAHGALQHGLVHSDKSVYYRVSTPWHMALRTSLQQMNSRCCRSPTHGVPYTSHTAFLGRLCRHLPVGLMSLRSSTVSSHSWQTRPRPCAPKMHRWPAR